MSWFGKRKRENKRLRESIEELKQRLSKATTQIVNLRDVNYSLLDENYTLRLKLDALLKEYDEHVHGKPYDEEDPDWESYGV